MKRNYNYPTLSLSEIVVEQGIAASVPYGASGEAGNIMSEDTNYTYTY